MVGPHENGIISYMDLLVVFGNRLVQKIAESQSRVVLMSKKVQNEKKEENFVLIKPKEALFGVWPQNIVIYVIS